MTAKSELIHIAAELVRGDFLPSDQWEDWEAILPKTTPKAAIREITRQASDAIEHCKQLAIRLRDVADTLDPQHHSQDLEARK